MSPQEAKAKMSPQEARSITNFLIADLESEVPITMRVIESVPAGKLDYTPDPKSFIALALIRHLVVIDPWFLNCIADGAFGPSGTQSDECGIMTPADGAARYKEWAAAAVDRVRALPDEKLAEDIDFFGFMKVPAPTLLALMIKHSVHHRGQLSSYIRPMGGKVPGIYGPSGDSQ
jgi:uncharacterized damage-inducible protein DinB